MTTNNLATPWDAKIAELLKIANDRTRGHAASADNAAYELRTMNAKAEGRTP